MTITAFTSEMIRVGSRLALKEALEPPRTRGESLGLVPTMGFLHEGHLSLVDRARRESDFLAVSIFVNPLQFGPSEDLADYPRDLERDVGLLRERGADLVFHPSTEEMYPEGEPRVTVDPGEMGRVLCGAYRPGHFRGVLTAVARLFGLFRPATAVFGRKDFQQAVLIRRMVSDLELGVKILTGPIVREDDGLAMSSRNAYLTAEEREDAVGVYRSLECVGEAFEAGERSSPALRALLRREMETYPALSIQYGELVHPRTLRPVDPATPGTVVAVAAFCGTTRLIDNRTLGE